MSDVKLSAKQKRKLIQALERRFGKSTMPYNFKTVVVAKRFHHQCFDDENGSFVEGFFGKNGRLCIVLEVDGAER